MIGNNLFSQSPWIWAGLIIGMIALPILIQLINLARHQTIRWAAMDFLIRSHRKRRNWIRLKQWLLLLSRIAALLLGLTLLAQVGCESNQVARLLGGNQTHHYILLDDSLSMADRSGGQRAFDRSVRTLAAIVARTRNRGNQKVTLLRYSTVPRDSATHAESPDGNRRDSIDQFADLVGDSNNGELETAFSAIGSQLEVSYQAVRPQPLLAMLAEVVRSRPEENSIVYLVSDFRMIDWGDRDEWLDSLTSVTQAGAAIECIQCALPTETNLALSGLQPVTNVRVANVPLMMELAVTNPSDQPVVNVQVNVEARQYPELKQRSSPEAGAAAVSQLPVVFLDRIEAGETVRQPFPVFFSAPGQHALIARLPDDSLDQDNRRAEVVSVADAARVLLVDNESQVASRYFSLGLNPGNLTGIQTETVTRRFLRDATERQLAAYDVIYLLDVDSLGATEISALEAFVGQGGGLACFVGPATDIKDWNSGLYRQGTGLVPVPLDQRVEIPERLDQTSGDLQPADHPVFAPARSVANSLLELVQIKTVLRPPADWRAENENGVQTLATVRGRPEWPFMLEKSFGKGHVVTVLSTAGPEWNNWTRNATFVPVMLLLQDQLASGRFATIDRRVGDTWRVIAPLDQFLRQALLLRPGRDDEPPIAEAFDLKIASDRGGLESEPIGIDRPGIHQVWLDTVAGQVEAIRRAYQVDLRESDLRLVDRQDLLRQLGDLPVSVVNWDQFNPEPQLRSGSTISRVLLLTLLLVLLLEQGLAYVTNYHRRG